MELDIKTVLLNFAIIIMRVPPLFVIDELLRTNMGVPEDPIVLENTENNYRMAEMQDSVVESLVNAAANLAFSSSNCSEGDGLHFTGIVYSYRMPFLALLRILASCIGCLAALYVFMLRRKNLLIVYLYLASIGMVFLSYWSNVTTINTIIEYLNIKGDGSSVLAEVLSLQFSNLIYNGPGLMIVQNYILQTILAYLFCHIHLAPKHHFIQRILTISFLLPSHAGVYPFSVSLMTRSPTIAAFVPLFVCKYVIWANLSAIKQTLYQGYAQGRTFITNYGLTALAETQWTRLHVPSVLRVFWIIRVTEQLLQILSSEDWSSKDFSYVELGKTLMVNGCETLPAVLGMTSIVSVICHYIGTFFYWVLLIDDEDEKSIGAVSAMLFYILALQTGLTTLDKEKRLLRLCRNLCLLFTAILLFVHNTVNPLLMSLSASHNPALHRHLRALGVCLFLIVFPTWLLTYLWSHYTLSTWLLAVSVFSVEVIVKVFVSLAIYSLFLYDAYRKTFWDELDDWVYIIRSFGNTVEFMFGIVLFFNGVYILFFEAGGFVRAILMCVHAYFNLYCEARAGWSAFMKRRQAVDKINSLPEASEKQIQELADVCAICYQEMESARITRCNHYFHGICLRKWLYVQDKCPICHEIMYKKSTPVEAEASDEAQIDAQANRLNVQGNNLAEADNQVNNNTPHSTLRNHLARAYLPQDQAVGGIEESVDYVML
ncbi:protein TRC8 homolog [Phymastichus coffea]|uniref:protein TRC8 homolog n=1 Tax=Phymastichus coffea TaxID=108790 RepID=UPI00273C30B1|nr:protein TRC8 homolog [Phymastichus coffea]